MARRLWSLEAAFVMLGGLALTLGLCLSSDLGWMTWPIAGGWFFVSIPLALSFQQWVVPLYLRFGFTERALNLAVEIREGAPNAKLRQIASIDVAMIQLSLGRFKAALRNLDRVKGSRFNDTTMALVIANRAYCRAHIGQEFERALEESEDAIKKLPEEGILEYVRGLCLYKLGQLDEARKAIESSLAREKDPGLPLPGERPWILSKLLTDLGEPEAAAQALASAKQQCGRSPFAQEILGQGAPPS